MPYLPHLHKCYHNFNWLCYAYYNNLLSQANSLNCADVQLKHKRRPCRKEDDSKWEAAWGRRPFTSSIQITFFLKHVEEALAHPDNTHISTFANQMSRLEKAEPFWPFKELWDDFLCFWELRYARAGVRKAHTHTHTHGLPIAKTARLC